MNHGRIVPTPSTPPTPADGQQLDSLQLSRLEQSFREWAVESYREDVRKSRSRILLIFLLIRYTGGKLSEVLSLRPVTDIDTLSRTITFRAASTCGNSFDGNLNSGPQLREVQISENLAAELTSLIKNIETGSNSGCLFAVDPAFVRRKFYERALACGFSAKQGGPEMIRKARGVELMRENMPLPAVQRMLGHSNPSLTSSYVSFSEENLRRVTRWFMDREAKRKTSARNTFFGKVNTLIKSDIQTLVELVMPDGATVSTIVTNTSVERLGLKRGHMITAEVKATWLTLECCDRIGNSSAENQWEGVICKVTEGKINTECAVRVGEGMELCAVLSSTGFNKLGLHEGDPVRVLFSCYAVTLHAD